MSARSLTYVSIGNFESIKNAINHWNSTTATIKLSLNQKSYNIYIWKNQFSGDYLLLKTSKRMLSQLINSGIFTHMAGFDDEDYLINTEAVQNLTLLH